MLTFFKAQSMFSSAKNKSKGKPLGTATYLVQTEKGYGVKYHNTIVVEVTLEGIYTLRSGGWLTVTTKKRINEYSPIRLHQKQFEWFLPDGTEFYDGMQVTSTGEVVKEDRYGISKILDI